MTAMQEALREYIYGKTVAIVGHAAWLLRMSRGAEIDSHDTVIRMNWGVPTTERQNALGRRTDVYVWGNHEPVPELVRVFNPKKSVIVNEIGRDDRHYGLPSGTFVNYDTALHQQIIDEMRAIGGEKPSTGALAIMMIMSVGGYKEINLFGVDWCKTIDWTCNYVRNVNDVPPHNFFVEELYMLRKILADPKIRIVFNVPETSNIYA